MTKLKNSLLSLCLIFLVETANAQNPVEPDLYSQCVDETIQGQHLPSINNAVVEVCSEHARSLYEQQIVQLLDQIKTNGNPERYNKIMKSQRLWKQYVDQECQNAGDYIGSPMYRFCPMLEYQHRVEQLQEYIN
ncbi:lysozyme inhibitor LprI family protein [Acinetobacter guerrae]|uniref:lysozyme inhibitor LprI family protein n=1 Tax=Acinetobacter guerrae TaxID=1843371 RepID=UPI00125EDE00|nr:lysozyme inhibitor LprI family protein [Acinetobacter guerrae]